MNEWTNEAIAGPTDRRTELTDNNYFYPPLPAEEYLKEQPNILIYVPLLASLMHILF